MCINPELLAKILVPTVNLWSSTFRYKRYNFSPICKCREQGQAVVFAIWHDEMFPLFRLHKGENNTAVVSPSNDGEILAQFMSRMGYGLARGSSSREGLRALKTAAKSMNTGNDIIFTVDGPTGPRHEVKSGAVYMALKFSVPLVPVRVDMNRKFVFSKSWDKFQLPLPFSRIGVFYGTPYIPSAELSAEGLRQGSMELEQKLKDLV